MRQAALRKGLQRWRCLTTSGTAHRAVLTPQRFCAGSGFDSDASAPVPSPVFPKPTLEKPHMGTPDGRGGVIIGSTSAGVRDNLPYTYRRAQFVGHYHPLVRPRSDAGDVLALIDICTGRASMAYMLAEADILGSFRLIENVSIATVSFNSFTFPQPVYEGDLILVTSRVISTGSSSLAVHAHVERQAFDSPVPSYVGEAYVTYVTIDARDVTKTVRGIVPAVRLSTPEDIERNAMYHAVRKHNKLAKERATFLQSHPPDPERADKIELDINQRKPRKVRIRDTTVTAHHHFGIKDVNANKVIFGGEILRVMERSALHCGRVFARNSRLFTLAMLGMTFDAPMYLSDLARCRARVLCVKRSTLLVRVEISAESANGRRVTNSADFILIAVREDGKPFEIDCGIELTTAPPEELLWYARARALLEESARNRVSIEAENARMAAERAQKKAQEESDSWEV